MFFIVLLLFFFVPAVLWEAGVVVGGIMFMARYGSRTMGWPEQGTHLACWFLREEEKSDLAHLSRGVLFITRLFPSTGSGAIRQERSGLGKVNTW